MPKQTILNWILCLIISQEYEYLKTTRKAVMNKHTVLFSMPLSAIYLDYSLHHSRTHPNTMNTITNTKRIRACNRGIVASIRYKCRSHFIKQIYELAAIIDLGSRHLHQVETESELQLQNCYRGGDRVWCRVWCSVALIRSVLRLQQCRMSHVARSLDNCRGQSVGGGL